MDDCIFCKIIKGEMKSYKVYEDDKVFAFLDIMPINKGHVLVVPKKHYKNILDAPAEVLCQIIFVVKKIAPAILESVGADGFNLGINNGGIAGQVVDHLHIHLMPRFPNDGHKLWHGGSYREGEAEKVCREIVKNI